MSRVLITGGASGLGLALAKAMLARGDEVLVGDLAEERPDSVPEGAAYLRLDVRSQQDWDATLADVRAAEHATRGRPGMRAARRRLLDWAARTPASHYYHVPVARVCVPGGAGAVDAGYVAFPTLGVELPEARFGWRTACEGDAIAVDRFKCLP